MMDTAISSKSKPSIPGYELRQLVGKGGMGEVHMATQLSLQRTVAVKLLKPELAKDDEFVARFEKEGAALATLRHPQIVSIVDRGKAGGTYYLVMEFVEGPSLRDKMRNGDFDANKALVAMLLIARAIEYAHGRGVVHRDLKPENILFDEQAGDIPKVSDFGLAALDESHGPLQRNLTQTHVSMGTASYMAPEQSVDAKTAGPRADIYSLGVMLYETLTGELPVGQFDPVTVKKPGLDKRLDPIIARCLKPSPADRYPTVTALLTELEKVVQINSHIGKSKETLPQRLKRRAGELGRTIGRVAAYSVVLVALAIIAATSFRGRSEARTATAGSELMGDFSGKSPLSSKARIDQKTHKLTIGEGNETVGLMAVGRKPELKGALVEFGEPTGDKSGRLVIDTDLNAGVDFTAVVDTQDATSGRFDGFLGLFRGPRPEARSALMLVGDKGRYVALVVADADKEPTLEWVLAADRRGLMQAPMQLKAGGQRLSLHVDPATGELTVVSGEGRDARTFGEPLQLGKSWRESFGANPKAALGCLEGKCGFRQISVQGLEAPRPIIVPPPAPPDPVVVASPKPPPKPPVPPKPPPKPPKKK